MPFAEFCCRSGGSNMNGGGLASGAEPATAAVYTSVNGNWNGTAIFTPVDSSTPASSVTVGDWAGVYNDGATTPVYIARVTAVAVGVNGAITLSTTAKSGTAPTSSATARTIKVGGAWLGPNGAVGFPFGFMNQNMLSVAGDTPRVNFKNDQTYTISAAMSHGVLGPTVWQGYTTTFGDLGRATINGGTTGTSFRLLDISGSGVDNIVADFIFDHNGATGSATGASFGSTRNQVNRCIFRNMVGAGAGEGMYVECEAYANNTANGANGGFSSVGAVLWCVNCISHDNAGSNSSGFYTQSIDFVMINCIAAHNGSHGFNVNNITGHILLDGCDAYNNAGSGLRKQGGSSCPALIRNSNFVKNTLWAMDFSGSTQGIEGTLYNNGYGSGTQQNGSGKVNGGAVYEVGAVTYASGVTPWVDPVNGDFRINAGQVAPKAAGAGRGAFMALATGFSNNIGYPDIGAVQHLDAAGGSGSGLVAFDGMPLVAVGLANDQLTTYLGGGASGSMNAVNAASIMVGQIFTEDGAAHTIDTTGSSSLGWMSRLITFANVGTTVKVGLAAVDTTNVSKPGRAVNVAGVITFDVSRSIVGGGGGITASAWQEHVPTAGSKTIANGDLVAFAIQMTARGGTDSVQASGVSEIYSETFPVWTDFSGAAYSEGGKLPNAVITFSDGKLGFFFGGVITTTTGNLAYYNNTSSPKEYGNFLKLPFPAKIYGIVAGAAVEADTDFVLYSDPLGTPVAERTFSLRGPNVGSVDFTGSYTVALFPTPYISAANQPLAVIAKPTTSGNVGMPYFIFANANHQKSLTGGMNGYAVNRSSGAFAAQNSGKDRFAIGLLVGGFSAGGGPAKLVNRIGT